MYGCNICLSTIFGEGAIFMTNNSANKFKTRDIAMYGLFTALVYVATRFINIPGPTQGSLFHLGNVMAFTIAIVFGKKAGAISGAMGMALFDITSPYAVWAPFTFIIRFAMGYVIGSMAYAHESSKIKSFTFNFLGIVIATVIMVVGYYAAEIILYKSLYAPLQSVWGNFMQCVVGAAIGLPLSAALHAGFKHRKISTQI
jgi:uncharacterized membrane protein